MSENDFASSGNYQVVYRVFVFLRSSPDPGFELYGMFGLKKDRSVNILLTT